ncbi:caspase-8-like [Hetaerina americana]|uniref:caspase-8-like n=1 Tax=Hetaerina americana TaxID=62018 RepID=UPI003A7F3432
MEAKEDSSLESVLQGYSLAGKKYAFIFSLGKSIVNEAYRFSKDNYLHYDDPNQDDVDIVAKFLEDLGFDFDEELYGVSPTVSSDDESSDSMVENQPTAKKPTFHALRNFPARKYHQLTVLLKTKMQDASCILMYFIKRKSGPSMINFDDKYIPISMIRRQLMGIPCPKIFIVQSNITKNEFVPSILLNAEQLQSSETTLPESANILICYLPNNEDAEKSVPEILREELFKPDDINVILTKVMNRLNLKESKTNPKVSSTLLKHLYLNKRPTDPSESEVDQPFYQISEGKKCLAYAFLFEHFDLRSSLTDLVKIDFEQLTSTFKFLGFDYKFCVKDGRMTVQEFIAEFNGILADKKKMMECECIILFLSSHGDMNGMVHASDGLIPRDVIVSLLSDCEELEGKPKLIFIDACRGSSCDRAVKDEMNRPNASSSPEEKRKDSVIVCSRESYDSVNENNMWAICCCKCPRMSDVMVVSSSTEGNVSFYRKDTGSQFIRKLCDNLKRYGEDYNLISILNIVMSQVADLNFPCFGTQLKQQVTFTSTLRKLLRFPK